MSIDMDRKLLDSLQSKPSLGLYNGKMGICLYFYYLGRLKNCKKNLRIASQLLDDIFIEINQLKIIGVQSGFAGIGLGINYLIKENYVKGNSNDVLYDIDNEILKKILYEEYYKEASTCEIIQIIYYLYERLLSLDKGSLSEELFQEAIIYSLNNIYSEITPSFFHEEPLAYDYSHYSLPQFLFILSKIHSLNFYNYRIVKIIEEITPEILSIIPIINANRLLLLWGINSILKTVEFEEWNNYQSLLRREINIDTILTKESNNRSIYFMDGLTGIYYLLIALREYFSNKSIVSYTQNIFNKINTSQAWSLLQSDSDYFDSHRGLAHGYCGVSILRSMLK